jgi:thiamine biosynthesis protein ThiI
VKAVKAKIEAEEENFDFSILDKVVAEASNIDIRDIAQQTEQDVVEVETVSGLAPTMRFWISAPLTSRMTSR